MTPFLNWAETVLCRLQWHFAIPPTRRQVAERERALAVFDAAFSAPSVLAEGAALSAYLCTQPCGLSVLIAWSMEIRSGVFAGAAARARSIAKTIFWVVSGLSGISPTSIRTSSRNTTTSPCRFPAWISSTAVIPLWLSQESS